MAPSNMHPKKLPRSTGCSDSFKVIFKRMFKLMKKFIGKSFPFVTALMNYKTMPEYTILWREIKRALQNEFNIRYAHFDYEEAAVKTFQVFFTFFMSKFFHSRRNSRQSGPKCAASMLSKIWINASNLCAFTNTTKKTANSKKW